MPNEITLSTRLVSHFFDSLRQRKQQKQAHLLFQSAEHFFDQLDALLQKGTSNARVSNAKHSFELALVRMNENTFKHNNWVGMLGDMVQHGYMPLVPEQAPELNIRLACLKERSFMAELNRQVNHWMDSYANHLIATDLFKRLAEDLQQRRQHSFQDAVDYVKSVRWRAVIQNYMDTVAKPMHQNIHHRKQELWREEHMLRTSGKVLDDTEKLLFCRFALEVVEVDEQTYHRNISRLENALLSKEQPSFVPHTRRVL
jgi:hypothetical protein